MFCPKCGTKNVDGAKFCQKCGQPLTQSSATGTQPIPSANPTTQVNGQMPNAGSFGTNSAMPPYTPAAGTGTMGTAVKPKSKAPVFAIIGAIAVAAVLLVVFLVVPAISSSNGVLGKVMSGDSGALSSATKANVADEPVYFSSQDAAKLIQEKVNSGLSSYGNSLSLSDDDVKTLDGQWALVNISPSDSVTEQSTGCVAYATVTKKTDFKAKDLADSMSKAGISSDHVVSASANSDLAHQVLSNFSLSSLASQAQGMCLAVRENKDYFAVAASFTFSNYTEVVIFSATPDFVSGTGSSQSNFKSAYQQLVSDIYVK